jgi:predicted nucleic acid-binding protein
VTKVVVVDSSCLIALSKIGRLDILQQLFERIAIPQAVYREVVVKGHERPGSAEVGNAQWIAVHTVSNTLAVQALQLTLGAGESESIVLAEELNADMVILDDRRARQSALELTLPVVGTLAVLTHAREQGYVQDLPATLAALRAAGFHFALESLAR